jgi:uncharacterized protein (TIGR03083 family)
VSDEFNSPRSEPVVGALLEEWAVIEDLLGGLDVTEWPTSTALPGQTVHDVVAHLIGTESRLAGDEEPPASIDVTTLDHVRNATGAVNEHWVRALHPEPPEEMRLRFRDVSRRRADMLIAMSREDVDVPTQTPVGIATYRRFMEIRVFDCWLHEQDIRSAVGRPGHEDGRCAELSVDEVVRALVFIVGKQAAAPEGSAVTVELIGPVYRTVHVAVEGRAQWSPSSIDPPPPHSIFRRPSSSGSPAGVRMSCQDSTRSASLATSTWLAASQRTSPSRSEHGDGPTTAEGVIRVSAC